MKGIDVKKVIERLKNELNLKYDAELARMLGVERTYLAAMKSRGEFTGTAWSAVFEVCEDKDIDVNFIVFGKQAKANSLTTNIIEQIVRDQKSAEDLLSQVEEAKTRYADRLPKDAYREELLRFAQKLIEAAL